jgi:CHAT domain-containing protein/lipoprotein NlpI
MEFQERSLAIQRAIGDRSGEAASLNDLGNAYKSLGQYQRAIENYEQSLAIQRAIGDRNREAISLGNLGNAYRSLGQYQQAIDLCEQYLAITREIGDRYGEADSLNTLGIVYQSLGQYQRAIEFLEQSLAIQREIGDRQGEAHSLSSLGVTHFVTNRFADSAAAFQSSLDMLELIQKDVGQNDRDRTSFLETQQNTYQGLQRTLIAMNQSAKALEIADRGRARSLLSFLRPETQAANQPLTAAEMQAIAQQQNGTIIHYSIVWEDLYIWVVPPTGEIGFRKVPLPPSMSNLEIIAQKTRNQANTLWESVERTDPTLPLAPNLGEAPLLRQVYDLLFKPIADLLPTETGSKIIIIPHRELAVVPFAALRDEEGQFLIDHHTLAVAPSVSVLAEAARRPKTSNGPALIVGNPAPMPDGLKPLPGMEKEAQAIAQMLKAQPLIGSQATETQVKTQLDQASLLHFATHGIVPNEANQALNSWLALTPDGDDDGKLTIAEIFDRQLSARLAVLSACRTGQGAVSGEGVIGLARAFLKAGVPTVVASLWKVPDEPTSIIMQTFYAERAAGKDAATALRTGMLKVKERYPGPKYWAAFLVIGDTISTTP